MKVTNCLQCKTEGKEHSPTTWSRHDSSEQITADRNSGIKMCDHEMSKSRMPRIYVSFQRRASQIPLTFQLNLLTEWCRMQAQEFLQCKFSNCTSSKIHQIERCFTQNLHTSSGLFCCVITCYNKSREPRIPNLVHIRSQVPKTACSERVV
jgi:hypothetical protein